MRALSIKVNIVIIIIIIIIIVTIVIVRLITSRRIVMNNSFSLGGDANFSCSLGRRQGDVHFFFLFLHISTSKS